MSAATAKWAIGYATNTDAPTAAGLAGLATSAETALEKARTSNPTNSAMQIIAAAAFDMPVGVTQMNILLQAQTTDAGGVLAGNAITTTRGGLWMVHMRFQIRVTAGTTTTTGTGRASIRVGGTTVVDALAPTWGSSFSYITNHSLIRWPAATPLTVFTDNQSGATLNCSTITCIFLSRVAD